MAKNKIFEAPTPKNLKAAVDQNVLFRGEFVEHVEKVAKRSRFKLETQPPLKFLPGLKEDYARR